MTDLGKRIEALKDRITALEEVNKTRVILKCIDLELQQIRTILEYQIPEDKKTDTENVLRKLQARQMKLLSVLRDGD